MLLAFYQVVLVPAFNYWGTTKDEIANITTIFLGLAVGSTMSGESFIQRDTLLILAMGLLAFVLLVAGPPLSAATYYIDGTNGDDSTGDGSKPADSKAFMRPCARPGSSTTMCRRLPNRDASSTPSMPSTSSMASAGRAHETSSTVSRGNTSLSAGTVSSASNRPACMRATR